MRRAPLWPVLALALLLTACTGSDPEPESGPDNEDTFTVPVVEAPEVDVDTPALRRQKAAIGVEPCPRADTEPVDNGLPAVTLPCLGGGRNVDLSRLRGPLLVTVWSSWCAPCRTELPIVQAAAERYAGRLSVLGIDWLDTSPSEALRLAEDTGAVFPSVADPQQRIDGRGPFPRAVYLPFVVLVDSAGEVAYAASTTLRTEGDLDDLLAEHLGLQQGSA